MPSNDDKNYNFVCKESTPKKFPQTLIYSEIHILKPIVVNNPTPWRWMEWPKCHQDGWPSLRDCMLLWIQLLPFLWFSATKQLTVTEWAFSTFPRNSGCLSLCHTFGTYKKSKFNRWLLLPWMNAENGSSGYLVSSWWSGPMKPATEKKGIDEAHSQVHHAQGLYTAPVLLLNGFFNWFQQILTSGSNWRYDGKKLDIDIIGRPTSTCIYSILSYVCK